MLSCRRGLTLTYLLTFKVSGGESGKVKFILHNSICSPAKPPSFAPCSNDVGPCWWWRHTTKSLRRSVTDVRNEPERNNGRGGAKSVLEASGAFSQWMSIGENTSMGWRDRNGCEPQTGGDSRVNEQNYSPPAPSLLSIHHTPASTGNAYSVSSPFFLGQSITLSAVTW